MSDIVERLEARAQRESDGYWEAAAEITALRARVAKLKGALEFYSCNCPPGRCENGPLESNIDTVSCGHRLRTELERAREALKDIAGLAEGSQQRVNGVWMSHPEIARAALETAKKEGK